MHSDPVEFVVRPNSSFHPYAWLWVFALLVVMALGIAIRFAWLGYWMILPFAIIDVLAVGLVLYVVTRKSSYVERIVVTADQVEIHHIQHNNNTDWLFPLHWTRVLLEQPDHRWYPHRLLLGCKGNWVEIGLCLTNDERESLARAIETEITRHDRPILV